MVPTFFTNIWSEHSGREKASSERSACTGCKLVAALPDETICLKYHLKSSAGSYHAIFYISYEAYK